jgi:TatD DNase family protein
MSPTETAVHLYDAHNHLQDERLASWRDRLVVEAASVGAIRMVVNGSCEEDWPAVLELARRYPQVIPSFGYHPWYVRQRTARWQERLVECLDTVPSAVGEIGLDRWIKDHDLAAQEEVFAWQLRLAAERNLPVSIHCLQAWGLLYDILRREPRPACGFLLHSYGGPLEMVNPLADLGAYFSLPGYFAHERKARQRETFRHVPIDRLLLETDAPDQCLPAGRVRFPLPADDAGKPVNHPGNLSAVYQFAAELLELRWETLADRVETNFLRLFGLVLARQKSAVARDDGLNSAAKDGR